jgi:hypothetical protein
MQKPTSIHDKNKERKTQDRNQFFQDTALVELALEGSLTDEGVESFAFYAKTVWAAYHLQQSFRDQEGNVRTYSFLVGPASTFEHVQYDTHEFDDWFVPYMFLVLPLN